MKSTLLTRIADKIALVGAFCYLTSFILRVIDLIGRIQKPESETVEE